MAAPLRGAISVDQELEAWLKELGLCDSFKLSSKLLLTPEAQLITQEIKDWIKKDGIKKTFDLAGMLMLYSGPRETLKFAVLLSTGMRIKQNHERAKSAIKSSGHDMLERTRMGRRLIRYKRLKGGIYKFFDNTFITEKHDKDIIEKQSKLSQAQADIIMGFASAALIFASRGNVETMVSGAALDKVFYVFELPALMSNPKIKKINGVKIDEFRKIFYSGDKDAYYQTFQKICEAEVALLEKRAKKCGLRKNALPWRRHKIQNQLWEAEKKEAMTQG